MIHEGLFAYLAADAGVLAYVDNGNVVRIFRQVIPQKIPEGVPRVPCLVYERSGVERQVTYCGTSGLVRSTFSIDSYAVKSSIAHELAAAVRDALLDYRGVMGGIAVSFCSLENEFDLQDIEPGLYRVVQSWSIWHEE